MAICDWPIQERPREKLLHLGASSLSEAELLAILLRVGNPGSTALDLARQLLALFGDLTKVLEANWNDCCNIPGLGVAKYAQLQVVRELAKRYLQQEIKKRPVLGNSQVTKQYLTAHLRAYQQEVFACLFLDNKHHLLCFEKLFFGSINNAHVYPRELIKRALQHNAAALILAHNHPSGVTEPSLADRELTKHLQHVLALVDIRLLDHVIVGDNCCSSFAERGWLS